MKILLSHNLRPQYQVQGSGDCSALIKASYVSADRSKSQEFNSSPWPSLLQKKVYILSAYIVGHYSPNMSKQSKDPYKQKVNYGSGNTKRVIIHNSTLL